jgi:hypothetical protein
LQKRYKQRVFSAEKWKGWYCLVIKSRSRRLKTHLGPTYIFLSLINTVTVQIKLWNNIKYYLIVYNIKALLMWRILDAKRSIFHVKIQRFLCKNATFFMRKRNVFHAKTQRFSCENATFFMRKRNVFHAKTQRFSCENAMFLIWKRSVFHVKIQRFSCENSAFFMRKRYLGRAKREKQTVSNLCVLPHHKKLLLFLF